MNNTAIEPIAKKYDELRYQLLPYTYTLAWQARNTGMPLMRAMWLHYPDDEQCRNKGDQYLWGKDMLIAPVYEKDAISRTLYFPKVNGMIGGQTKNKLVATSLHVPLIWQPCPSM